eukprot:Opistho-1_new@30934
MPPTMVVGSPWSSTVRIYTLNTTTSANSTNSTASWTLVQTVTRTQSGTPFSRALLPLFGHSVAITPDARFIAVGAPGYGSGGSMETWTYSGAFMLLTRLPNGTYSVPSSFTQLASPQFWDRFGSRVSFSPNGTWLFVTANGGWRGASLSTSAATSSMGNTGVHAYRRNDTTGAYTYTQSIPSFSLEPFGLIGIHVASGMSGNTTFLAVRDYVDDASLPLTLAQQQQNKSSEAPVQTAAVVVYSFNGTRWVREQTIASADPRGPEDWFGAGLATHPSQPYVVVGAPKSGRAVHFFARNGANAGVNATFWGSVHSADNPGVGGRSSFFGGAMAFAREGRVLLVADATAGGQPPGTVSVFRAFNTSEKMAGIDELRRQAPPGDQLFRYDLAATLDNSFNATLGGSAPVNDQFGAALATSGDYAVVGAPAIGCVYTFALPTIVYVPPSDTIDGASNPNITHPTATAAPTPAAPTDVSAPPVFAARSSSNDMLALILGVVCGGVGLICVGAGSWRYAMMRHKRQKMELLKQRNDLVASRAIVASDGTGRLSGGPL